MRFAIQPCYGSDQQNQYAAGMQDLEAENTSIQHKELNKKARENDYPWHLHVFACSNSGCCCLHCWEHFLA